MTIMTGQTTPDPNDPVDVRPYLEKIELLTAKLKQTAKRSKNRHKAIKELYRHIDKLIADANRAREGWLKRVKEVNTECAELTVQNSNLKTTIDDLENDVVNFKNLCADRQLRIDFLDGVKEGEVSVRKEQEQKLKEKDQEIRRLHSEIDHMKGLRGGHGG